MRQERESSVYAIVRCGGRQEKATVDEVLTVDTLDGEAGSSVNLPALLVVDDDKVISNPAELSRYQVTAEILGTIAGPKINMIQFKNKTGYRRRLGHRQKYTQVKITSISAGRKTASAGRKAAADGEESATAGKASASGKAATSGKAASGRASASRSTAAKSGAAKAPAAKAADSSDSGKKD
jgi:large subunit ribosomal protein L21